MIQINIRTIPHIAKICLRFLSLCIHLRNQEKAPIPEQYILIFLSMQKTTLRTLLREEILRAVTFGWVFFIIVIATLAWVANAASGGLFGDIMEKILGLAPGQLPSYTGNGTVQNAAKLGGNNASAFQKIATPGQSCGSNQCIYGFDTSGNILCR